MDMIKIRARLDQLSIPEPNTGCVLWIGSCKGRKRAYGAIDIKGKTYSAHRISWLIAHGEIPVGLSVLHKCDTGQCINPDHLFLGTAKDNAVDCRDKKRFHNQIKTECKHGHLLSGTNLYICPRGYRECRTCRKMANKRRVQFG